MKLDLTINMDHYAFERYNGREVARILHNVAERMADELLYPGSSFTLLDVNGNNVGEATVIDTD